jgi:hypothetical protein
MATYFLVCDLSPDSDPSDFDLAIKSLGESEHLHDCAWLITTNKWHNDICGALKPFLKPDGFMTVFGLTGPARRWVYSVADDKIAECPL